MSVVTNPFETILIANRGEIACRIIRTAKQLGYRTVAVYSDADKRAPHVLLADLAEHIGAAPVTQSYLSIENILAAAERSGAQAIHPGYGFLSENADFAQRCNDAGLVFIGPAPDAIHLMGNKAKAKRRMQDAQVLCVPGYEGEDQSDEVLLQCGAEIGFPLMVKAAAGGGGRGMRLVDSVDDLASAIKLARSEAENAFGSGELILEKAIIEPRHVEVQIFADTFGHTIYLGERDCSVQRRHQKVLEEAPCPIMTPELRAKMGAAAIDAAKSIGYVGAGTVEFLLDQEGAFYFLEMNTRLQVEHPVTELVTGLDLVALQLQVAQGQALGISQEQVRIEGHAIEARLYSEDPANDFLPVSGHVALWKEAVGEGVRVDAGITSEQEISPFYDPMVAKIVANGTDRETARRRLVSALESTALFGLSTNQYFLKQCLNKPTFVNGQATTAFIAQEFDAASMGKPRETLVHAAIAAVLDAELSYQECFAKSYDVSAKLKNWSSSTPRTSRRKYVFEEQTFDLSITANDDVYSVADLALDERLEIEVKSLSANDAVLAVAGVQKAVNFLRQASGSIYVGFADSSILFTDELMLAGGAADADGGGEVRAPMHGLVFELLVEQGQSVRKGDCLLVLEAMKMQHQIIAQANGVVEKIYSEQGKQVAADDILIEITRTEQ